MDENKKEGLKPILNKNIKILILGSLPSDESIKQQKYYAKSSNDFWKLISKVLNINFVNMDYRNKIETLLNNNIGLWDVFKESIRKGSLDSEIKSEELNNFSSLKELCPNLKLICFNGKKAGEHKEIFEKDYLIKLLPSSSGANRKDNIKRIKEWKSITSDL